MLRTIKRIAVAAVLAGLACEASRADEITLAAGAGFRRPIAELATAFEKASGHKILQVYGHMGQVLAQARESGRVSLVCGDSAVLVGAPGITFSATAPLGLGKLVVAYRKGLTLAKPEDITRDEVKRIAIPDQANAIYGKAGRQFLERAQLGARIDPKLITVATVPQVTSYVASGEVDAGFVNATDAIGMGNGIGGYVEVPSTLYDPVAVICGIIDTPTRSAAPETFAAFLATEPARAILTRYGL